MNNNELAQLKAEAINEDTSPSRLNELVWNNRLTPLVCQNVNCSGNTLSSIAVYAKAKGEGGKEVLRAIAQNWIPEAFSVININSRAIASPSMDKIIISIQKQLGIDYDRSQFTHKNGQIWSFYFPPIFDSPQMIDSAENRSWTLDKKSLLAYILR